MTAINGTISLIIDKVIGETTEWCNRPLEAVCSVLHRHHPRQYP
jgi:hypothetical protein